MESNICHAALTIWNSLPSELTDNFNNVLLSGFKCSLKTYFNKLSSATVSAPAILFFKLTRYGAVFGASPAA